MKQSEKDELLNEVEKFSTVVSFYGNPITEPMIKVSRLRTMINNLPVDKEEIKEVYAIRELTTGEIIWSARGSAYKVLDDVNKKIKKLKSLEQNKDKFYKIITYKLEE